MSKKKRNIAQKLKANVGEESQTISRSSAKNFSASWWRKLAASERWLALGIIAFVALGTFGAGLKYLEEDARQQRAARSSQPLTANHSDESLLNSVNPFLEPTTPTPTPQLSKEYLYAGSRLLSVEDANANAAPPADLAV